MHQDQPYILLICIFVCIFVINISSFICFINYVQMYSSFNFLTVWRISLCSSVGWVSISLLRGNINSVVFHCAVQVLNSIRESLKFRAISFMLLLFKFKTNI